ncbi:sugar-binding transcriptional regulator [Microbacterium keratanolyticum]
MAKSSSKALAARAAWLQLIEDRSNIEIAEELGVSRLRVPKLVRWAEDHDVLEVLIRVPSGIDWEASQAIRSRFGLADALTSLDTGVHAAARLAARFSCEVLTEGGSIGIAWGRSAQAMVAELERMPNVPQVDIVQLIGGLPENGAAWHSAELLVRLSAVTGGEVAGLLSPMIVPDVETARGLREEPSIARAFAQMREANVVVVGIGAWGNGGSRVHAELDDADRDRASDVVADVCGILLDAEGRTVHADISERMISIDETTLRERPVRIGVAVGEGKVPALRAALRSGLLTVLCTDVATAQQILKEDEG